MGCGETLKCPDCGYEFYASEGVGFLFPKVYQETLQEARDGKLGPELQTFLKEHDNGAINAEYVTLCCNECGHLDAQMDSSMYLPKTVKQNDNGDIGMDFPADKQYYMSEELEEHFDLYAKYPHRCAECGGAMHVLRDSEPAMCPRCRMPLNADDVILWD